MARTKELGPDVFGDAEVPQRATDLPLSHAHPMLSVTDVDAAIDYYRSSLGFFVEWAHRDDSGSTAIANLWRGALSLFLMRSGSFGPSCLYCQLDGRDELDALHADLLATEAKITGAPVEQPWGVYEMRVADLDGNQLRFACISEPSDESTGADATVGA